MSQQNDSDPLPYVQVDRAVRPRAALLAGAMGVTVQHALGSLVEWWELCGDPRELERLLSSGIDEVLLTAEEARLRFQLASGHDLDPAKLAALGLLERKGEQFRVRGMSRYLAPIRKRVAARAVASAGGKASAAARLEANGSAQPSVRKTPPTPEAKSNRRPKRNRTDAEPTPEPARTLSVSGQRSPTVEALAGEQPPAELRKLPDPTWQALIARLTDAFATLRHAAYTWGPADFSALKALRKRNTDDEIQTRWVRGLVGTYAREVNSVAQLASGSKWNALATEAPGPREYDPNQGIIIGAQVADDGPNPLDEVAP